jgi:hypothetical protein
MIDQSVIQAGITREIEFEQKFLFLSALKLQKPKSFKMTMSSKKEWF